MLKELININKYSLTKKKKKVILIQVIKVIRGSLIGRGKHISAFIHARDTNAAKLAHIATYWTDWKQTGFFTDFRCGPET